MNVKLVVLFASLFVAFYSYGMDHARECIIFIGNPGVGKSTLVNSMAGEKVFESGVKPIGVTKTGQSYEQGGFLYIDTPGLADTVLRGQAAVEIEKALKKNALYRVIFVLTLEAGRVKPEDLHTINRVMEAIGSHDKQFSIIVNKLTGQEKLAISEVGNGHHELCAQLNSQNHKTDSICYIKLDRDLEDNKTPFIVIDERIRKFIHQESKAFWLRSDQVTAINSETAEELKRRARAEEQRLRVELEQQRQRDEQINRQIAEQKRKLDELHEEEMRLLDNSLDVRCGGYGDF